ncbi:sensor histidine kinase [Frigoribacterium salinisoli]
MTRAEAVAAVRRGVRRAQEAWPAWATDVTLVVVAGVSLLPFVTWAPWWDEVLMVAAAASLALRRRWPWVVVVVTAAALLWADVAIPLMIALVALGARERRQGVLLGLAVVLVLGYLVDVSAFVEPSWLPSAVLYAGIYLAAPLLVGVLLRTRRDLRDQIDEMTRLRDQDRRRAGEIALAQERAVLAREMHDVVSHQVTLIAVQAGALQLSTADPTAREVAGTVRRLAAVTMDELRSMVEVLRTAGGGSRALAPQPVLADVPALVADSGITVHGTVDLPDDLPPVAQRAVYRFVQEGLTNAGKHAPGSDVVLTTTIEPGSWSIALVSGPARSAPLALPSAHHGLVGLRERAELLGGTVTAVLREDGTHRLVMTVPG